MLSDEFLDTARRLAAGTSEGDWRSAVSRAYYACFHYFLEFLDSHRIQLTRSGQKHQIVYQSLNNCGLEAIQDLSDHYLDLNTARNAADYDAALPPTQPEADDAVRQADKILEDFEAELLNTPAATVAAAIRAYLVTSGRIRP